MKRREIGSFGFDGVGEQGCEFEINQAKTAVGLAIGDVAHVRIIMADAKGFEFGEQFLGAGGVEVFNTRAAVGGDDLWRGGISFQQPRDEGAFALFEMAENADFVFETFLGIGAVVSLDDPTIEGQVHGRPERIFNFEHEC